MKNLEKQQKCTTNSNDQNRSSLRADEVGVAIQCRCSSSVIPEIDIPVISNERSDERSAVAVRRCRSERSEKSRRAAFTLVELVITIAIVIILSVISVPIYRGYVEKAKYSEAYALLGTILSAQKSYYSEYGNFLGHNDGGKDTCCNMVLGIDARGNKYFSRFHVSNDNSDDLKFLFKAGVYVPMEMRTGGFTRLLLSYNITEGSNFLQWN